MRVGVVGLGKMGLSHLSMIGAHPDVTLAAVCDSANYLLDVLSRYTGVRTYSDYDRMLAEADLDAVVIATPTRLHASMVQKALEHDVHVFCEKPFVLTAEQGEPLIKLASGRHLVGQVGYHNRFVGSFREVKRLLEQGTIGTVSHALAEAYGPVVLRPHGGTWRSQRSEGGGCLYDYAAHPLNLLNWYMGNPSTVGGTVMESVFSRDAEDEVYSSLYYANGTTAQLSVNWSDESYRKMTTRITIWGSAGRIFADRQEIQVFLRDTAEIPEGYRPGWNVRYTTELTDQVWFYVRGEEYSAQLDAFVRAIKHGGPRENSFESALATDRVIQMMIANNHSVPVRSAAKPRQQRSVRGWFRFA